MRTFFTADRHLFHNSVLKKHCKTTRYGEDVDEMHELMIEAHNRVVDPGDIVYDIGDVSFGSPTKTLELLKRMNGVHVLILGNHDNTLNDRAKSIIFPFYESVHPELEIRVNGQDIHLHHMPQRMWNKMQYGTWHLYGHVHGDTEEWGKSMDVGIDARDPADMAPWSFEEVKVIMDTRPILKHHGD